MIENTIPTAPASTGVKFPSASPTGSGKPIGLASDFETFLKMLTAQARYQDPLEPIDSTEYAAQLAQFSMVEQQVQTNEVLSTLVNQLGTSSMASLAGLVGMDARADMPVHFDGRPITVQVNPDKTADQAYLVVNDTAGTEVQRLQIPISSDSFDWAGVSESGLPLASGIYEFSVQSFANGKMISSEATEVYGRIIEAQVNGAETTLIMKGGQSVSASSITALRGTDDLSSL